MWYAPTATDTTGDRVGASSSTRVRDLEDVVMRCLRKRPDERPRDGAELYDALMACEEPRSAKASGERVSVRPRAAVAQTGPVPLVQRARATAGS